MSRDDMPLLDQCSSNGMTSGSGHLRVGLVDEVERIGTAKGPTTCELPLSAARAVDVFAPVVAAVELTGVSNAGGLGIAIDAV